MLPSSSPMVNSSVCGGTPDVVEKPSSVVVPSLPFEVVSVAVEGVVTEVLDPTGLLLVVTVESTVEVVSPVGVLVDVPGCTVEVLGSSVLLTELPASEVVLAVSFDVVDAFDVPSTVDVVTVDPLSVVVETLLSVLVSVIELVSAVVFGVPLSVVVVEVSVSVGVEVPVDPIELDVSVESFVVEGSPVSDEAVVSVPPTVLVMLPPSVVPGVLSSVVVRDVPDSELEISVPPVVLVTLVPSLVVVEEPTVSDVAVSVPPTTLVVLPPSPSVLVVLGVLPLVNVPASVLGVSVPSAGLVPLVPSAVVVEGSPVSDVAEGSVPPMTLVVLPPSVVLGVLPALEGVPVSVTVFSVVDAID